MTESIRVPDHRTPGSVRASGRADEAAEAVIGHFGHRLFGLPFTHLAAVARPAQHLWPFGQPWHYWWQAHYLDCLVDAGWRELERGQHYDGGFDDSAGALGARLLRTIRRIELPHGQCGHVSLPEVVVRPGDLARSVRRT